MISSPGPSSLITSKLVPDVFLRYRMIPGADVTNGPAQDHHRQDRSPACVGDDTYKEADLVWGEVFLFDPFPRLRRVLKVRGGAGLAQSFTSVITVSW
ncbi:MAG: hypothetical protein JOY89_00855 [Solirubrobacterales bacterium]|nr:hypothetical protein [Solirubrobacterales bacterium]